MTSGPTTTPTHTATAALTIPGVSEITATLERICNAKRSDDGRGHWMVDRIASLESDIASATKLDPRLFRLNPDLTERVYTWAFEHGVHRASNGPLGYVRGSGQSAQLESVDTMAIDIITLAGNILRGCTVQARVSGLRTIRDAAEKYSQGGQAEGDIPWNLKRGLRSTLRATAGQTNIPGSNFTEIRSEALLIRVEAGWPGMYQDFIAQALRNQRHIPEAHQALMNLVRTIPTEDLLDLIPRFALDCIDQTKSASEVQLIGDLLDLCGEKLAPYPHHHTGLSAMLKLGLVTIANRDTHEEDPNQTKELALEILESRNLPNSLTHEEICTALRYVGDQEGVTMMAQISARTLVHNPIVTNSFKDLPNPPENIRIAIWAAIGKHPS